MSIVCEIYCSNGILLLFRHRFSPTDSQFPVAKITFRGLLTGNFPDDRGKASLNEPRVLRSASFSREKSSYAPLACICVCVRICVCRKSIQLAGFHAAKPGAIVPGIGIFTTPSAPLRWPKQPAIITAISVSGIFQPFLISPLRVDRRHLLPLSTSSTMCVTASERAISYEKRLPKELMRFSSLRDFTSDNYNQ